MNAVLADPAPLSARFALREATSALHAAVEARFAPLDLTRRADYAAFLRAHAEVVPALELALEGAGIAALLPDWPSRRRAAELKADLEALGLAAPAPAPVALAPGGEAIGAAYVLEGSRLGAAVLLRTIPDGLPTGFLRHGLRERLFQSFLPRLDALTGPGIAAAVAGARRAFGLFLRDRPA